MKDEKNEGKEETLGRKVEEQKLNQKSEESEEEEEEEEGLTW